MYETTKRNYKDDSTPARVLHKRDRAETTKRNYKYTEYMEFLEVLPRIETTKRN